VGKIVMRKVTVNLADLLDIFFGGMDGDWIDYMYSFLRDDLKVTEEDIKTFAKELSKAEGYGEEDEEAILEKASYYIWNDKLIKPCGHRVTRICTCGE